MNWRLLDIRVGRANNYQFALVVAAIVLVFFCAVQFTSFEPAYYYVFLFFLAYVFFVMVIRRMRDMTGVQSVDLPMIWDLKVIAGYTFLPKRFKQLALFFGDGYPLSKDEWAKRIKETHMYKSKTKPRSNEMTEAPVRERTLK